MKKMIIAAIILAFLGIIIFIARLNLPRFSAYVIGAVTESSVTIGEVTLARKGSSLDISLKNIGFKGNIEGTVRKCNVVMNIAKGIYFKEISISDFEITVKPVLKKGRSFTFPAERIDIRNGVVIVSGQKIIISNMKAENINVGDSLTFEAHLQNGDYIGTIGIRGQGTYNMILTDIKGDIDFTAVNLAKFDAILKGAVNGKGTFSLKEDKFVFAGKVEAAHFELNDTFLKRPVLLDRVPADVVLSAFGSVVDIKIENALYKETPFALNIRLDNYQYTSLELSSDFLNVQDVTSYATSKYPLQEVWDALKGGQVRAKMLRDIHKGPITVDLEVKDVAAVYEDMHFSDIKGQVYIDMSKVDISNLSGRYKTNTFHEVNSVIPYEDDKPIRAKGKYTVNLKDMPPFIDLKGVTFRDGTTDGTVEVEARRGQTLNVSGSGKLHNALMVWENTSFSAGGSYRFSHDGVVFDPLMIRKDGTEFTCRGKWNENNLDFSLKGILEPKHLSPFMKIPFNMSGTVGLDGELHLNDGILHANGDVNMDGLTFEIPGFMKKEKDTKSAAHVKISKKSPDITIDDLSYELESINVRARGTITDRKKINANIALDAHDIGRVAKIFFLPEETTKGDVSLNLAVKDLEFPVVKLPYMVGNVKIENGFFRLPGLTKPLSHIDLVADFRGTSFDVQIDGLNCGKSVVQKGMLKVNGLETPRFSLSIDMERFNLLDFSGDGKKGFRFPLIPQDGVLARTSGEMFLTTKEVMLGDVDAKNLEIKGFMTDRKIIVSGLKMGLFDGEADVQGTIDLSGRSPGYSVNGKLGKIKSDIALKAFGSKTQDISGTGFINGNLRSEGDTVTGLIDNMDGEVTIINRDGVIKKWNLLSKIFGALNLYDLLRGKVDFGQNGLGYSKLGATFTGNKGIFHTSNFLLDSSSMVLTGSGQLDLNKKEIDGVVNVSPLIVLDRTLEQIPIVRSILKEPGQGFLYLSYSVKGPLDDPEIASNVISTIGSKTIEILRNILELPKGVFE